MTEHSAGDAAQTRAIAEQVADAAVSKFAEKHPEVRRGTVVAEIPAPLRWAAIIISAILTVSASAGLIWIVTSLSTMSNTLARLDERMSGYVDSQSARIGELERRTGELEGYHRERNGR